ncbi:amino acid ABC transporter substrate-binding protein [Naasia aerilata]|uniref:Amino acid ABC transporter substrate-binding protein n=1 Tax=Naasia aerilata TaxID=1162966 RepID=A0ABN6XNY2_9MICO|nr:amino acid ABC transporter substrate-binding protein [Naasia aerilata]BDZ45527.1 amino acid ABC transporter substrate-binding protein [Naasia aerilata]
MKYRLPAIALLAAATIALTGCSTDSASGKASGDTLADVTKAGEIVFGTEGTYRPFSFHEDGSGDLTGYDVEIAQAVAKKLGVKARFEETQWDAIFGGLESGRFDAISNQVSITPEREKDYLFSEPYTVSQGVIVTLEDNTDIASFADLAGKTTAQSLTSNWYELAQKSGANVEEVEGWAQAVTLVQQHRVDATINDELTWLDYRTTDGANGLKVVATTEDSSKQAFAFPKGSETLVAAVNDALDELRADGTLAKISDKYFGDDVTE